MMMMGVLQSKHPTCWPVFMLWSLQREQPTHGCQTVTKVTSLMILVCKMTPGLCSVPVPRVVPTPGGAGVMRSSSEKLSDFEKDHLAEVSASLNRLCGINPPEVGSTLIKRHKSLNVVWNWPRSSDRSESHLSSDLAWPALFRTRSRRLESSDASLATSALSDAACRVL